MVLIAVVTLVRTLGNSENVPTLNFINGSTKVAMAIVDSFNEQHLIFAPDAELEIDEDKCDRK